MEVLRRHARTNTTAMNIEFHVPTSPTTRQYWSFWVNGSKLVLDLFQEQEKPAGKRVWRMVRKYDRIFYRRVGDSMLISEVPFSDQIAEIAKAEFVKMITVETSKQ